MSKAVRYRLVDVRIWVDAKFQALSDDGKLVWFYLLTNPNTNAIPGLYRARVEAMAADLGWSPERFREGLAGPISKGMAKVDPAGLVWIPKAIHHDPPANGNVVAGWARHIPELPECPLRSEAFSAIYEFCERYRERLPEPILNGMPYPSPIQDPGSRTQDPGSRNTDQREHAAGGPPASPPATTPQNPADSPALVLVPEVSRRKPKPAKSTLFTESLALWGRLWQEKYRAPYVDAADHKRFGATLAGLGTSDMKQIELLFRAYLRDPDPFYVGQKHPLRMMDPNRYRGTSPSSVEALYPRF